MLNFYKNSCLLNFSIKKEIKSRKLSNFTIILSYKF